MSANVSRGERAFDRVMSRIGVTSEGQDWLKVAIDPFHDKLSKVCGYPDTNNSLSVVQVVPITATISCPSGITNANWSCHILNLPWITPLSMELFTGGAGNVIQTSPGATSLQALGGVACLAGPDNNSSTQWAYANFTAGSTTNVCTLLTLPSTYGVGKTRIIASGVEVYNTTADINKQGAVTVYRSPVPDYQVTSTYTTISPSSPIAFFGTRSITSIAAWPISNNDSLLLRGSRTWKAEDGSYQTHVLHSMEIPCDSSDMIYPLLTDSNSSVYCSGVAGSLPLTTTLSPVNLNVQYTTPVNWTQYDMSGAIYTGLSPSSTLLVRWNVYVERFPDSSLKDLVVLSNPSPEYDSKALEAYSIAMSDMPVGVPVAENGFGDWFSGVVGQIADTVGNVASAIPHPAAQGLAMGAKMGSKLLSPPGNVYINKPMPLAKSADNMKAPLHKKENQKPAAKGKGKK